MCIEMSRRILSPGTPPLIGAIPELEDYALENVRTNGRSLGSGAYGSVEELDVNGVACAGKIIHEVLLQPDNQGVNSLSQRFVEECKLMSHLRHPHIVQFLGICQLNCSRLPVLVMELLMTNLDALLSKHDNIPLALKSSMLYDVAKGLTYLHEQQDGPIIHRDLTARNVLLDSALKAKIADFGVARIVNLSGREVATMSRLPGTLVYMAPECSPTMVRYNSKLDIFSFGVLALFTIIQEFPVNLLPATYNDPVDGRLLGRTEIDRRRVYVDRAREQLGGGSDLRPEYKLVEMMELCLENDPEKRPTVTVLLAVLQEVCGRLTDPYLSMHKLQLIEELARLKEGMEVPVTGAELEDRETRAEEREARVGAREARVQEREETIAARERELVEREVGKAGERETVLERQIQELRAELDNKNAELEFRDRHIEQLEHWQDPQLQHLQDALRQAEAALEVKNRDLKTLLARMEKQEDALRQAEAALEAKDRDLKTLLAKMEEKELNFRELMAHKEVDYQKTNEQLVTTAAQLKELQEKTRAMSDELTNMRTKLSKEQQVLPRPPQPSGLRVQLPVTWRVREPIHFGTNAAQSVTLNGKVIVGGGDVPGDNARKVAFYDPGTRKWGDLGLYSHQLFAMAVVCEDLLLVGGYDVLKDDYTGIVSKYNRDSKYWQQCYPDMPTARSEPAAVGFRHWLVVAGGYNGVRPLAVVEILNTLTSQWQAVDPLPTCCTALQPAAYLEEGQDTWYLLGGGEGLRSQRPAFCTCLSQLVQGEPGVWRKIPEPPYSCSGAVTVRGYLVAMGGRDQQGQKKGGIHAFLPGTCEWLQVAELPTPRYGCTCATLPSGRLLVVGGREEREHSTRVDMATITGI